MRCCLQCTMRETPFRVEYGHGLTRNFRVETGFCILFVSFCSKFLNRSSRRAQRKKSEVERDITRAPPGNLMGFMSAEVLGLVAPLTGLWHVV